MVLIRTSSDDRWWLSNISSPTKRPCRIRYTITNPRLDNHKIYRIDGSTQPRRNSSLIHPLSRPIFSGPSREDVFRTALLYQAPYPSSSNSGSGGGGSSSSSSSVTLSSSTASSSLPPSSPPDSEGRNASVRHPPSSPASYATSPTTPEHLLPDDARRAYEFRITQLERDLRAATVWAELLQWQREELLEELTESGIGDVMVLTAQTFAGETHGDGDGDGQEEIDEDRREIQRGLAGVARRRLESGVMLGLG